MGVRRQFQFVIYPQFQWFLVIPMTLLTIALSFYFGEVHAQEAAQEKPKAKEEDEEPARVVKTKDPGSLKGGVTRPSGGEQFGLKW